MSSLALTAIELSTDGGCAYIVVFEQKVAQRHEPTKTALRQVSVRWCRRVVENKCAYMR